MALGGLGVQGLRHKGLRGLNPPFCGKVLVEIAFSAFLAANN